MAIGSRKRLFGEDFNIKTIFYILSSVIVFVFNCFIISSKLFAFVNSENYLYFYVKLSTIVLIDLSIILGIYEQA
jgi:bacteriorhodopsin